MKDISELKKKILEYIDLSAVLKSENIVISDMDEEQIHCPFHGPDKKKSARFYKRTDTIYCFTCKDTWNLFSYLMKRDNISFPQVVNLLISKYRIDISGVPDALEGRKQKRIEAKKTKYNIRNYYLEKLFNIITEIKNDLPSDKYAKLVFAYMLLKHNTNEDKFEESLIKIRDAILRLKKGTANG